MISVETTRAVLFGRPASMLRTKSIEINPAEQPIPDKLYDIISDLILNSLITIAQSEGVGEYKEQLITKMSIAEAFVPVASKTLLTQSKITD